MKSLKFILISLCAFLLFSADKYPDKDIEIRICLNNADPEDPIEYVERDVCLDSGSLRHVFCPEDRIERRKYIKDSLEIPSDWCSYHKAPEDPDLTDPPIENKTLSVRDGLIYYGDEEITLCGVSRREALWRSTGEFNPMGGWGSDYSLAEYESDIDESDVNYVRHLGIMNTPFMIAHIKRMKKIDVIVEIEVYDAYKGSFGILVDIDSMDKVSEIGNVFFDVGNEFLNDDDAVDIVINIAKRLKAQGCIVSAGAWSGVQGKEQSKSFYNQYKDFDIFSHHREWRVESFNETLAHRKPVVFSEYFSQGNLTLDETKAIMKTAFDMGIHVQYYGFRFEGIPGLKTFDPFHWKDILTFAGELVE